MERIKLGIRSPARNSISNNSSSNSNEPPLDQTRVLVRAGSSSIMVNTKETGSSAMWDKETTHIFCNICIEEIEIGNRPTTYFNKEGWQNIAMKFKELTGRNYDRMKFKNKWDQLKKDWKIWKELKRGSTGLGWDPIKRTVDASDEWWNEKLQAIPSAKKYKVKGIEPELEDKLDQMFRGVVATGLHSFNLSPQGIAGISNDLPPEQASDSGVGPSINPREIDSAYLSKRPRLEKRRKGKDDLVKSSIDKLIEVFSAPPPAPPTDSTIVDFLLALDSLPEVVADSTFYVKCVQLLEDPTRRHIFMGLRPELRVKYLRVSIQK